MPKGKKVTKKMAVKMEENKSSGKTKAKFALSKKTSKY